jgi:hypothetical protein
MPFQCPQCNTLASLRIVASLELPPDSRSDEITLQVIECARSQCGFVGLAVYEESRRGAEDTFHHTGYYVSAEDVRRVRRTIARCPKPRNPRCDCPAHRELGRKNAYGRWDALDDVEYTETFQLKLSRR